MTGLSSWQRSDGFPSDEYFDAVISALQGRGLEVVDHGRDADWDFVLELGPTVYADGPLARFAAVHIVWRTDEDDEPKHAEDFTGRGWYWVPSTDPQAALGESAEDLALAHLAAPDEVAAVVAALLGTPPGN